MQTEIEAQFCRLEAQDPSGQTICPVEQLATTGVQVEVPGDVMHGHVLSSSTQVESGHLTGINLGQVIPVGQTPLDAFTQDPIGQSRPKAPFIVHA